MPLQAPAFASDRQRLWNGLSAERKVGSVHSSSGQSDAQEVVNIDHVADPVAKQLIFISPQTQSDHGHLDITSPFSQFRIILILLTILSSQATFCTVVNILRFSYPKSFP